MAVALALAPGAWAVELTSDTVWAVSSSPIVVTETLLVAPGATLRIEPGVIVRVHSNASLIVKGSLHAEGAGDRPITFTSLAPDGAWPGLAFLGSRVFDHLTATGTLAHCLFENAAHPSLDPHDLPAAISAQFVVLSASNCTFRQIAGAVLRPCDSVVRIVGCTFSNCGEAVNVVQCDAEIKGNRMTMIRQGADAIDVDLEWSGVGWKPALVENNIVSDCSGDGIDLGSSAANVRGNLVRNCADKGISVGEGSNARIENNVVLHCRVGVAVKDSSAPVIANNTIFGCRTGVSCYEKDLGVGGARGHVVNTIIWACGRSVGMDELSLLDVRHSIVEGPFLWPGEGNLTNDPLFVSATADHLMLAPSSPAIGSGTAARAATNDFRGAPRPASPSMGAFELSTGNEDADRDGVPDSTDAFPLHPSWSTDADNDGLPEDWELSFFATLAYGGLDDPDGDGLCNRDEFLEGLAPTNAERHIVINELMYCPTNGNDREDFVELLNFGDDDVSMAGWQLTDEVLYDFPPGTIVTAGQHLVIAGDPAAVEAAYGITGVLGPWQGSLGDEGAVVRLINANLSDIDNVDFRNYPPWPASPSGDGPSLELMQATADNAAGESWAASENDGGTPGTRNSRAEGNVVINEFLASSVLGVSDWIELYNRGPNTEDLSGWRLTDDLSLPPLWTIPDGTQLLPGQTIRFTREQFGFGLSAGGETLWLQQSGTDVPESRVKFGVQLADVSEGRWPNGIPSWSRYPDGGSPAAANPRPPAAAVFINEIMYHPASENDGEEYIELLNNGPAVNLTGWAFTDGIGYSFAPGTIITSGQYLVVANDPAAVTNKYGIGGVLGPFTSGRLSNAGESLVLRDAYGNVADAVHYLDRGRWPRGADGEGSSLERLGTDLDSAMPETWRANPAAGIEGTPGAANGIHAAGVAYILAASHYPVTPGTTEQVLVRARVRGSPADVRLMWKRDEDSAFNTVFMTNDGSGAGVYMAGIPVQTHRTLVEYYIAADDGEGNAFHHPFGAPIVCLPGSGHNVPQTFRYICLRNLPDPAVTAFRVLLPQETITELTSRDLYSDELLPATFVYLDEVFPFARLRYRGSIKRIWQMKSYRIDLSHDHPFAGEKDLNINGKRPGPEWLATQYFHQRGFATALQKDIRLHINHQDQGPYLLAEDIGNAYLERNFSGAGGGTWYESWGETGSGTNTAYPPAISNCLAAMTATASSNYTNRVAGVIDPDQWLRWLSVVSVVGDRETLLSGLERNHACYIQPSDGRLQLQPLDLDAAWRPEDTGITIIDLHGEILQTGNSMSLHVDTQLPVDMWPPDLHALNSFMGFAPIQRRYYEMIANELDHFFRQDLLTNHIAQHFNSVGETLESTAAATLDYVVRRIPDLESQLRFLVGIHFHPTVTTLVDWPYAEGSLGGYVLPGTTQVFVDGSTNGVSYNVDTGEWRCNKVAFEGENQIAISAQPLSNRSYVATTTTWVCYDSNDNDGDGLGNSWERFYGFDPEDDGSMDPQNGAEGDADRDGVPNRIEFSERTNPVQYDHVVLRELEWSDGQIRAVWFAQTGIVYRVSASDTLASPEWTPMSIVTAESARGFAIDFDPARTARFYQVIQLSP
ncbi:MAG: hypothetical protein A2X46_16485 [Lentisphaerae bacterium GWF2_57_35]|nr:MAG: hypothetical protein A2X46_16485 [Lentisphaerae bacterium GWF2_57_35]